MGGPGSQSGAAGVSSAVYAQDQAGHRGLVQGPCGPSHSDGGETGRGRGLGLRNCICEDAPKRKGGLILHPGKVHRALNRQHRLMD